LWLLTRLLKVNFFGNKVIFLSVYVSGWRTLINFSLHGIFGLRAVTNSKIELLFFRQSLLANNSHVHLYHWSWSKQDQENLQLYFA
jgi:hypothetical protein